MIRGLTQRPGFPDLAAALRSLVGVALIAAVAVQWAPPGSATAVVGTAAIAGATAFQEGPRSRVPLVYLVSGLSGLAVLAGAVTAAFPPVFVVMTVLWCFGAAMLWSHGPNAGVIGAATTALLVSTPAVPPSPLSVLGATALTLAAGLIQALIIVVWPPQRWRAQREAVVTAYRSLAADTRRLGDGDGAGWAVTTGPLVALREAFTTDDGPRRRRSAVYRGWYALPERIAGTLSDIAGMPRSDALRTVLAEAADTMAAVADTTRSGRVGTDVAISRFDSVAKEVQGPESGVVQRLSTLLHEVVAMRLGDFVPSTPDAVRLRRPELPTSIRAAIRGVNEQWTWRSPVLRHAVRVSLAVGLGCAVDRYADAPHGYWIPLTVLMVLRPETAHTYTRCAGRVAGSVAGIVLGSGVLLVLDPPQGVSATFAVVAVGVAFVVSGLGFVAMAGTVSLAAVFLIDIGRAAEVPGLIDPVLAALFGGALAVIAHVVLPDDELTRLAQRAGELLRMEIDYAAAVIKGYVHDVDNPEEEMTAAWQRAFRARAAFEATAGAMGIHSRDLRHWLRGYRTGLNALTSSCTTLESHRPVRPSSGADRNFVLTVDEFIEALCGDPPTAASPWTVDATELAAAEQRLREAVPRHGLDEGQARVLVAEIGAITRTLTGIAVTPATTAVR